MHALQNVKYVNVSPPVAIVDNASWTTNVIDTTNYDYLVVLVSLGTLDIAMVALKLQEADAASDATTLTGGADITGMVFGTSTNAADSTSTLPAATADNNLYAFELDLRGHKKYVKLVATGGDGSAGSFMSAVAILGGGHITPTTAAQRNIAQTLRA